MKARLILAACVGVGVFIGEAFERFMTAKKTERISQTLDSINSKLPEPTAEPAPTMVGTTTGLNANEKLVVKSA